MTPSPSRPKAEHPPLPEELALLYRLCQQGNASAWAGLEERYGPDTRRHLRGFACRFAAPAWVDEHLDEMVRYVWSELFLRRFELEPAGFDDGFRLFRRRAACRFLKANQPRSGREVTGPEAEIEIGERPSSPPHWNSFAPTGPPGETGEVPERIGDPGLAGALDRLPGRYKAAIHLHVVLDEPFGTVAVLLGTTESTARTWFARGLARLRNELSISSGPGASGWEAGMSRGTKPPARGKNPVEGGARTEPEERR
jgi:hypothetical protein